MSEEWLERKEVQNMFLLTTKQFGRVLRNIKRRHKYDYCLWTKKDKDKDNKSKMYINKEFVEWLRKVYFNKGAHCLTSGIEFYKEKIFDLENKLGIDHKRNKYVSTSLRFLPYKFGKSISAIHVALHRIRKTFPYSITFEDDEVIYVKEEGVKWLHENYFRSDP